MKYMILTYASQQDYDGMAGKDSGKPAWTGEDFAAMGAFMEKFGPYAETQEVLAGYWIVECESFDRATEIASRLGDTPAPDFVRATAYADIRPIVGGSEELVG
jgi:hypothetical protein